MDLSTEILVPQAHVAAVTLVDATQTNRDTFLVLCIRLLDFLAHRKLFQELDLLLACCWDQVFQEASSRHTVVELFNVFVCRLVIVSSDMWSDGTRSHLANDWQLSPTTLQDCQHQFVLTMMFWLCPISTKKLFQFVRGASRVFSAINFEQCALFTDNPVAHHSLRIH